MYVENPTPSQISFIRERQQIRLSQLNELPAWTNDDFDVAFYCYHEWCPVQQHWGVTAQSLLELLSNPQVPEEKADRIAAALRREAEQQLIIRSN